MERLRNKLNGYDFQHFINGIKKENPRHISKQLSAIEQILDADAPVKSVFEYTKAGHCLIGPESAEAALHAAPVDYKNLDVYSRAFEDRVARSKQEVAL